MGLFMCAAENSKLLALKSKYIFCSAIIINQHVIVVFDGYENALLFLLA